MMQYESKQSLHQEKETVFPFDLQKQQKLADDSLSIITELQKMLWQEEMQLRQMVRDYGVQILNNNL